MGDFIDFADIINQINRREMNRTYEFNLMLVGLTGLGKSTLVKSLFQGMIIPEDSNQEPKLNRYSAVLEENGVKLRLTCIETSNYDSHSSLEYVRYIDEQLKSYFVSQRRRSSWNILDTRVHCCLYLIPPYGKMKLRKEDIDCMKALHEKVNLIPVIAKSDTFNSLQLDKFKENILADLEQNDIHCFKFQHDDKEDEERFKSVKVEAERFPFAIVAADEPICDNKKNRWIRSTISGQIDIADNTKCDFDALAKLLIRHCMLDLMDSTHVRHYGQKFKKELLEASQMQNCRNLQALGLKPHEIKRIEHDIDPVKRKLMNSNRSLEKQRLEMERELQGLRHRIQTLKTLGNTTRSRPSFLGSPHISIR